MVNGLSAVCNVLAMCQWNAVICNPLVWITIRVRAQRDERSLFIKSWKKSPDLRRDLDFCLFLKKRKEKNNIFCMNRARLRGVIDRRRMWLSVIALSSWPCMQLARLLLGGGGRGLIDGVNKDSVSHYFSPFWVAVSFFSFFSFLLARRPAWNTLKSCGWESVLVHLVTHESLLSVGEEW